MTAGLEQKAEIISERIAAGERPAVTAFWPHEVLNALLTGDFDIRSLDAMYYRKYLAFVRAFFPPGTGQPGQTK